MDGFVCFFCTPKYVWGMKEQKGGKRKPSNLFKFRQFDIVQEHSPARVGTDGTLLGAWAPIDGAKRILDVGTGTGLVALMLAQRAPEATLVGVEKHAAAAAESSFNFAQSPFADRMKLLEMDFRVFATANEAPFDLIVSNPPYFRNRVLSENADRNSWRQQDHLGLDTLVEIAAAHLTETGRLGLVLPIEEETAIELIGTANGLFPKRKCYVHTTPAKPAKRILLELSRIKTECQVDKLIVQTGGRNEYSPAYLALTCDFHPWIDLE